jgi:hypothetical protein
MKRVSALGPFALLALGSSVAAQPAQSLEEVVQSVAGTSGGNEYRTRKLVRWMNPSFTWSYTHYQKRTVDEIAARK